MCDRVFIVIPAYNAEKYLAHTVASVQAQTLQDWRCAISNDGSTDSTRQIAEYLASQDPRISVLNARNGGVSLARNRGAALATDEQLLLFLDADDVLLADAIATLKNALRDAPDTAVAHGYPGTLDKEGRITDTMEFSDGFRRRRMLRNGRIVRSEIGEDTGFEMASVTCPIVSPGCAMVRRSAFESVKGFDSRYQGAADWQLWTKLVARMKLKTVDQMTLRYRIRTDGMSSNHFEQALDIQRLRRELITDAELYSEEQRAIARAAYRAFNLSTGLDRLHSLVRDALRMKLRAADIRLLAMAVMNLFFAAWGRPPAFIALYKPQRF